MYLLIFPLIAYIEINGFVLFGSSLININEIEISEKNNNFNSIIETISLSDIVRNNKGIISYSSTNNKNYNYYISNNIIDMSLNGFEILEKKIKPFASRCLALL